MKPDYSIQDGRTPKEKQADTLFGVGAVLVIGGLVVLLVWWLSGGFTPAAPKNIDVFAAQAACEQAVNQQLKAPASAQYAQSQPTKTGNGWVWNAHVDAQNSFGANIRTGFTCEVIGTNPDTAQIKVTLK